MIKTIRSW